MKSAEKFIDQTIAQLEKNIELEKGRSDKYFQEHKKCIKTVLMDQALLDELREVKARCDFHTPLQDELDIPEFLKKPAWPTKIESLTYTETISGNRVTSFKCACGLTNVGRAPDSILICSCNASYNISADLNTVTKN